MITRKALDVTPEHLTDEEKKALRSRSRMALMWLGIVSIIMMFSGLTSGYIVRMSEGDWIKFELPSVFYISTAILLLSSFTLNYAFQSIKKDDKKGLKNGAIATLILGIAFLISQWMGWSKLVGAGIHLVGNPSGSFFYMLTGLHILHLLGGIIALAVVSVKASLNKYNADDFLGVRICALYWHFLDVLWVYLFLFLLYVR